MNAIKETSEDAKGLESRSEQTVHLLYLSLTKDHPQRFAGKARGFAESLRGLVLEAQAILKEVQRNRNDARRGDALAWDGVAGQVDLLIYGLSDYADTANDLAALAEKED